MLDLNTIEALEKEKCTGCGACYNICPTEAIKMETNSEGFLYPVIDKEKCISCGLCKEKCPQLKTTKLNYSLPYITCAEDKIRKESSSGGMFTVLAEYILSQKGYVCGAAWEDYQVKHIIVDKKRDLQLLRKSKYLQSDINQVYKELEKLLKDNKYVLFSGCPCQVDGLLTFLGDKEYPNLLTVDLVCHGVPSPTLFRKYLMEKSKGNAIKEINFRNKEKGWGTPMEIVYSDGSRYFNSCTRDEWYLGFLNGIITRESCSRCQYANIDRIGDITIGDFWGVKEINSSYDDGLGTGLTLINTPKGAMYYRQVEHKLKISQSVDKSKVIEIAKKRNGQLLAPKQNEKARERFFELVANNSFLGSIYKVINNIYDIGIVGWWYNDNYGGTLTYFALNKALSDMGKSVLMIEKPSFEKDYKPTYNTIPRAFAKKHYHISACYHPYKLGEINKNCMAFLSGSDQLFNYYLWQYSGPNYFLDFADARKNMIAYASSFGNSYEAPEEHTMNISYLLHRFNSISVREDFAIGICKEYFDIEAVHVADPVFLCDKEHYNRIANQAKEIDTNYKYLISFVLDPSEEKRETILHLSSKLDMQYNILTDLQNTEEKSKKFRLNNILSKISIEGWVKYYRDSSFVLTDSFHGTCFAIIFKKQFISIANKKRGNKRFTSLLNAFGLQERLINEDELTNKEKLNKLIDSIIDYNQVEEKSQGFINDSYNWLKNAVFNPPSKAKSTFNLLETKINKANNLITNLQRKISELEIKLKDK